MFYLALDIARKLHLLPALKGKPATVPAVDETASDACPSAEPGTDASTSLFDVTHWGMPTCIGTPNGPMTPPISNYTQRSIAGGDFAPTGHMSYCEAAAKPRGPAYTQHPGMCDSQLHPSVTLQDSDVPGQGDQSSVPNSILADLDVESLGNQLEAFITRKSTKLIKQAKELLPKALETALKTKVQSIDKEHEARLQQVKEQAAADTAQLTKYYEQQLRSKDEIFSSLSQKLADSEQNRASLQTTVHSKQQEVDTLQAELAAKSRDITTLQNALDDANHELDCAKCKGRELLTYQGLATAQANQGTLRVALKDLSTSCDAMVNLIRKHGFAITLVPDVVDLPRALRNKQQGQQVSISGLKHALWNELLATVMVEFRQSQLVMGRRMYSNMQDPEAILLQLQLEKKMVDHWLKVAAGVGNNSAAEAAVDQYTNLFMKKLLGNHHMLRWNTALDPTTVLTPAARQLVAHAMKVQIIASAMHSQLIRVVVPGWLQDTMMLAGPAAPASWARWPGVLPLSRELMQAGAALPAAGDGVLAGTDAAAVFCQEPAVVQLAERVEDLPEFGGQKPQHGAYKVLVKARMVVAR